MAVKLRNGIVLRNPAEKAKRYAVQLKCGFVNETGQKLSSTDTAWRLGYLQARKDEARAFKSNQKKKRQLNAKLKKSGKVYKTKATVSRQKTKKRNK